MKRFIASSLDLKTPLIMLILFILAFCIKSYAVDIIRVSGNSMSPTLQEGNYGFLVKAAYWMADPKPDEIVVIELGKDLRFIKRVAAIGGDTVSIQNGVLYVNGEQKEVIGTEDPEENMEEVTVPEDCYFVLGDNRTQSLGSRSKHIGMVSREKISGKFVRFGLETN